VNRYLEAGKPLDHQVAILAFGEAKAHERIPPHHVTTLPRRPNTGTNGTTTNAISFLV
jgi:hypothetical protein